MFRFIEKIKSFDVEKYTFRLVGIDLDPVTNFNRPGILKHSIIFWLLFTNSVMWLCSLMVYAIKFRHNVNIVAENLTNFAPCSYGIFKLLSLLVQSKRLKSLIAAHFDLNEHEREDEMFLIWRKEARRQQFISASYFLATGIVFCSFALTTPAYFLITYIISGQPAYLLPLKPFVPFDYMHSNVNFSIVYISNLFNAWYVTSATIGVDTLFTWFVYNISAHLRILSRKFSNLAEDIKHFNNGSSLPEFGRIIRYHNRIIALTKEFNKLYTFTILVNVGGTVFYLCFLLFQMNIGIALTFIPITQISALLCQVAVYCFCGEKIRSESEQVYEHLIALFPWESMNSNTKRLLLLPLSRCQQHLQLGALFFIADNKLIVWIFKSAFSFFTILRALNEESA